MIASLNLKKTIKIIGSEKTEKSSVWLSTCLHVYKSNYSPHLPHTSNKTKQKQERTPISSWIRHREYIRLLTILDDCQIQCPASLKAHRT